VLVIGGTGRTGRHVVGKLLAGDRPVRVLTRDPARAGGRLEAGVDLVAGDVTLSESVVGAMRSVGAVVVIVESSNSDAAPNGPQWAHYGGMRNVISAASPDTHVVLVSQIYITRPERYPEVRSVIEWRRRAEEALRASGLPYTVVRPSWLTGEPGGGQGIRFEQGDTGEGQISREDVAEVCVAALLNDEEALGKTFEVYNEPGSPPEDWARTFAALSPDGQA
jgi:uncharacterized protein YbjT (DUF2867 family)